MFMRFCEGIMHLKNENGESVRGGRPCASGGNVRIDQKLILWILVLVKLDKELEKSYNLMFLTKKYLCKIVDISN